MSKIGDNGGPQIDTSKGYTLIHNDWANHPLVGVHSEYFRFWVDLLMNCSYRDGTIKTVNGHRYELRAGELIGAISYLANRWGVTPKRVRTFIDKADQWRLVTVSKKGTVNGTQRGTQAQTININNYNEIYERLAKEGHAERHANGHAKGTQEARKGHESNYIKDINNINIPPCSPPKGDEDDYPANVRPVVSPSELFTDPYFEQGVGLDEKGRLQLVNGEYSLWLERFGGNATTLQLALDEIQAGINPKSKTPVLLHVRRQLAQIARRSLEQDKRYEQAASKKGAADKKTPKQIENERAREAWQKVLEDESSNR